MSSVTMQERIREILTGALDPEYIRVTDFSASHAGHLHAREEGSHVDVRLVSACFRGLSRIERQRRVNSLLAPLFQEGLHALTVEAKSPGEGLATTTRARGGAATAGAGSPGGGAGCRTDASEDRTGRGKGDVSSGE